MALTAVCPLLGCKGRGVDFQQREYGIKAIVQRLVRLHLGYSPQSGPLCEVLGISTRQGRWLWGEHAQLFIGKY